MGDFRARKGDVVEKTPPVENGTRFIGRVLEVISNGEKSVAKIEILLPITRQVAYWFLKSVEIFIENRYKSVLESTRALKR